MSEKAVKKEKKLTPLFQDNKLQEDYNPERFLQFLVLALNCKTPYGITLVSNIGMSYLSKIKHRKLNISDDILLFAHDVTGLSIAELKAIAGIKPFIQGDKS